MEIGMKEIYKNFKKGVQYSIKAIAEKHCISPLNVLTATSGEVFGELMNELEAIADMMHADYDIDKENVWQMWDEFQAEVISFICPDWYSTLNNDDVYSHLNRQLVKAGYETVKREALELLFDEIQQMKPAKEDETNE